MNQDEKLESLNANKKQLDRILGYFNKENISLEDSGLVETLPENLEVLNYKAWGLRHASSLLSKGPITFDDIDVRAITGVDDLQDALDLIGVSDADQVTQDWVTESIVHLDEDIATCIKILTKYLQEHFSLSDAKIDKIKQTDPAPPNSDEMEKVRSIFGR